MGERNQSPPQRVYFIKFIKICKVTLINRRVDVGRWREGRDHTLKAIVRSLGFILRTREGIEGF